MPVKMTRHGDISIAYEPLGAPSDDPLLLLMGLGGQLVDWPDGFCSALTDRGLAVVRFDNRDSGLSTSFVDARTPSPLETVLHPKRPPPYRLEDMAGDGFAVMDALGWSRAH